MITPAQFLTELELLGTGGGWIFWALIVLAFGIAYALLTLWSSLHFPDAPFLSPRDWTRLLRQPAEAQDAFRTLADKIANGSDPGRVLQETGQRLFAKPDRRFPFAFVMIGAAPLIGLLGTVSGMFKTFSGMSVAANSPIDVISSGISEALITTQTGLVIGVPTYIVCAILKSRYDDLVQRYRQLESRILLEKGTAAH
jgi:biopolymer transport protein ExbB